MWRRRTLLVGLGTVLGACGFRPMYLAQGKAAGPVRTELAAIEVQGLGGRLGYLLREALLDELNPATAAVPPRYVLSVQLSSRADALGIQLDATITRSVRSRSTGLAGLRNEPHAQFPPAPRALRHTTSPRNSRPNLSCRMPMTSADSER